MKKFKQI